MDLPLLNRRRPRPPLQHPSLPLPLLLLPLLLLTIATLTTHLLTTLHDPNLPLLLSQCHARARLPQLTKHLPATIATPLCFLLTLPGLAASPAPAPAVWGAATLAPILAGIAALVTVTAVESARAGNVSVWWLRSPMLGWVGYGLLGGPAMGAVVWQVGWVPVFLRRGREVVGGWRGGGGGDGSGNGGGWLSPGGGVGGGRDGGVVGGGRLRHVRVRAEGVAVPVAVAVGFVVPAVLVLVLDSAVVAGVWLLFPLWVSLVRRAVRAAVVQVLGRERWGESAYLEKSPAAVVGVYAVPVLCSVLAHAYLVWALTQPDDRREMTRSVLKAMTTDAFFLSLTILYWVFVEAGWRAALLMVGTSAVLGPGAGICAAWVYRERVVDLDRSVTVVAVGSRRPSEDADPSEETPLLR